ncbi:AraC-like DNA-binding protein [Leucobacter luti]|uniref:helix-turn-helix domain-containing protein n=1 Tax=Leucobacter luti TaxID=340320 RepID=UPI0010508659|nr:helix-turn-helix domain-containing protein [Leucobacter luti]MCW2286979.1 AraC-like DNA-binding protein [Leucobacter luti]TCK41205.1 AraC-like DNA-binding protein [Leucobacter luti]
MGSEYVQIWGGLGATPPSETFLRGSIVLDRASDQHRHPFARSYLATAHLTLQCLALNGPLQARVGAFTDISFVHVQSPALRATWGIPERPAARATVVIPLAGDIVVNGSNVTTGQIALLRPGRSAVALHSPSQRFEALYICFSDSLLEGLPAQGRAGACHIATADSEALEPLIAFGYGMTKLEITDETHVPALRDMARNCVRALVARATGQEAGDRGLYAQAREIMAVEYTDVTLDTARLAARLGVSVRSLQAAFARQGDSVAMALRTVRGRAAVANRAANPELPARTIAEISGFGSDSTMFRVIRSLEGPRNSERPRCRTDQTAIDPGISASRRHVWAPSQRVLPLAPRTTAVNGRPVERSLASFWPATPATPASPAPVLASRGPR